MKKSQNIKVIICTKTLNMNIIYTELFSVWKKTVGILLVIHLFIVNLVHFLRRMDKKCIWQHWYIFLF